MAISYDKIYKDTMKLYRQHGTRDPKTILENRGVNFVAFNQNTKLLGMYKVIKRNRFVFYNPYVDENLLRMVLGHELGHDLYHRKYASNGALIEYELFNINSAMELEANIFAAHLLLDEDEIIEFIYEGYTYDQLAATFNVNVNLMIFKLNEMHRMGLPIRKGDLANREFFIEIDGKDPKNIDNSFHHDS
ncbi:MAG: ImmA/IrrE family metallo-endopeptidase [Tissierellia bacterium]|nr:ImmA/IrrE family metallo-endopeptidase [Tissierellia bacterium]